MNIRSCFQNPAYDGAVLCTHGEVMSPLLESPEMRSLMRDTGLDAKTLLTKGTAWRLRLTPTEQYGGVCFCARSRGKPPLVSHL